MRKESPGIQMHTQISSRIAEISRLHYDKAIDDHEASITDYTIHPVKGFVLQFNQ